MTRSARRQCVIALVAAGLVAVAAPTGSAGAGAAAAGQGLTIYAVAKQASFTDHADDRERGLISNPFNVDTKALTPPKGDGKGPQVGDNARFSFTLYSDPTLKKRIGSAVYACTFSFAKLALCQADFQLNGGNMIASGPAHFDRTSLTLAVSGGTGKYLGARGQVSSAPASKNANRLTFALR